VISPVIGLSCHRHSREACFSRTWRQRRGARTTRLRRPHRAPFVKGASAATASHPALV